MNNSAYTFTCTFSDAGELLDIECNGHRSFVMLGPSGKERELAVLDNSALQPLLQGSSSGPLPVLFGAGTGAAIQAFLNTCSGPLAIVDKEIDLLDKTGVFRKFASEERILWVIEKDPSVALSRLTQWQIEHGLKSILPLVQPFYLRVDRDFYGAVQQSLQASAKFNFWEKAAYPKFTGKPRILLLTSKYFLIGEFVAACERQNVPHYLLEVPKEELGQAEFVEKLLSAIMEFKPDFVFTINHLGVDREGVLVELLERLRLPLASWFVDSPLLILHLYKKLVSPWTALFTYDIDNVEALRELGFEHVEYLPLGTDPVRFSRKDTDHFLRLPEVKNWVSDVTFVGNSMIYKVAQRMKAGKFPAVLLKSYKKLAKGFEESNEHLVRTYLEKDHPDLFAVFKQLATVEIQLAFEAMITWEATRQYRFNCVSSTLPFNPLIIGDPGWNIALKREKRPWRIHKEVSYYSDLPVVYCLAKVNFNCTSQQMKGAVNQRVFDVPATGSFILTDWRYQIENLFEPEKEVICYKSVEEATALTEKFLKYPKEREAIAQAAYKRVLAHHTYDIRLNHLLESMQKIFG